MHRLWRCIILAMENSLILEDLLIGGFKIYQAENLYRFTSDSVILSRFAKGGQKNVVDLCSGSGIVSIHYQALNGSVERAVLCEVQKDLADMSKLSIEINGLEKIFSVENKPLQELDGEEFDLVLCNPPFVKKNSGILPSQTHLAICKNEVLVTFEEIAKKAYCLLKKGGLFTFCHRADRLSEILVCLEKTRLYPTRLQLVSAKENGESYLVLIEAQKEKKAELKILPQAQNLAKDFSGNF